MNSPRANVRLQRLLKAARFKEDTRVENINYTRPQGLIKSEVANLLTGEWIGRHHSLMITGPTGCGKTYLASAIRNHSCHHDYSVCYYRDSRSFESLTISHGDGSYLKFINQIARADLLIIDDWGGA